MTFVARVVLGVATGLTAASRLLAGDGGAADTAATRIAAARLESAEILDKALTAHPLKDYATRPVAEIQAEDRAATAALRAAALAAAEMLGQASQIATRLRVAAEEADTTGGVNSIENGTADASRTARVRLQRNLAAARDALSFKPTMEAELPVGFPSFTPVDEIEIREYPAYRLARTGMRSANGRDNGAFGTLFFHITRNSIPMTAPVEMNYDEKGGERPREASMAFLYANTEVGRLGPAGKVEVVDVAPMTVVSIGRRGDIIENEVLRARELLRDWLARSEKYEAVGELRVMGWNSPFIADEKKYFEVQIPVRKKADATTPAPAPPANEGVK